jgi:hypothetical protein
VQPASHRSRNTFSLTVTLPEMATDHRNPASHSRKSLSSRPQRPGHGGKRSSTHAVPRLAKKSAKIHEEEGEEDIMAASFLQYWYEYLRLIPGSG